MVLCRETDIVRTYLNRERALYLPLPLPLVVLFDLMIFVRIKA